MSNIEDIKRLIAKIGQGGIRFKRHFYERTADRPISERLVKERLTKVEQIQWVEEQPSLAGRKYKIWMKLSNRYSLVVIAAISRKGLYIITGWNTDRKWQKR